MADKTLPDPRLTAISGLIPLATGIVVVSWPAPTLLLLAVVGGLYVVLIGFVVDATALKARSIEQTTSTAA